VGVSRRFIRIACVPQSHSSFMTGSPSRSIGRPNLHMENAVLRALRLFNRQQADAAIALMKKHDIPLPVVERPILRRGPRRQPKVN
jgi:hypothetical protein